MGQGCSGDLSNNPNSAVVAPTASSAVQLAAAQGFARKNSAWKQLYCKRIEGLLAILSAEDVATLLWIFRARCFIDRSKVSNNRSSGELGKGGGAADSISGEWKRISLDCHQLYSLFPSIHASTIAQLLDCLSNLQSNIGPAQSFTSSVIFNAEDLRFVSAQDLLRACQVSEYLFNPRDTASMAMNRSASISRECVSELDVSASSSFAGTSKLANNSTNPSHTAVAAPSAHVTINSINNNHHITCNSKNNSSASPAASDILFQDFCVAMAICKGGTAEEQLALLYVLFSEQCDARTKNVIKSDAVDASPDLLLDRANRVVQNPTEQANSGSQPGNSEVRNNTHGLEEVSVELPIKQNSIPYSSVASPPLKTKMFSFSLSKPQEIDSDNRVYGMSSYLENRTLSELGALRLLLFLHFQLLRFKNPALSLILMKKFSPSNGKYVRSLPGWVTQHRLRQEEWTEDTSLLMESEELGDAVRALLSVAEAHCNEQRVVKERPVAVVTDGISFAEFVQIAKSAGATSKTDSLLTVQGPPALDGMKALSTLRSLTVNLVLLASVSLKQMSTDVIHSGDMMKAFTDRYFLTSRSIGQICRSMQLLGTNNSIPLGQKNQWEVFMIEASWFLHWCAATKKKPVFPDLRVDVPNAHTKKSKKAKSSKIQAASQKYEMHCLQNLVINLIDAHDQLETVNKLIRAVPRLNNSRLLESNSDGGLRLKPLNFLQPYSADKPNSMDIVQYVLVPSEFGRHIYEYYDDNWASISPNYFTRTLRFASSARPIEGNEDEEERSEHGNGKSTFDSLQALGPTASRLIHNFKATLNAELVIHPPILPLYACTSLGTTAEKPIDVLRFNVVPSKLAHVPRSCSVTSCEYRNSAKGVDLVTLGDFLSYVSECFLPTSSLCAPSECNISGRWRLWGLYRSSSPFPTNLPHLQYKATSVWRLLTGTAADYDVPLSNIVSPHKPHSSIHRNSMKRNWHLECLGFMVEPRLNMLVNIQQLPADMHYLWPTQRILAGQRALNTSHPMSAEEPVCPFSISEQVDVLLDTNQWVVAVVTNIVRENSPEHSSGDTKLRFAVRPLRSGEVRHVPTPINVQLHVVAGDESKAETMEDINTNRESNEQNTASKSEHSYLNVIDPSNEMERNSIRLQNEEVRDDLEEIQSHSDHADETVEARGIDADAGSDMESAIGEDGPIAEALPTQESLEGSVSWEDSAESLSGSEDESTVVRAIPPKVTATTEAPIVLREEDVPFSPNGVTFEGGRAQGEVGTTVVAYDSLRVLRLGTMTTLPTVLSMFHCEHNPGIAFQQHGEGLAAFGPLVEQLIVSVRKFEAEVHQAVIVAKDSTESILSKSDMIEVPRINSVSSLGFLSRQSSMFGEGNRKQTLAGSTAVVGGHVPSSVYRSSFLGRQGSVAPLNSGDLQYDQAVDESCCASEIVGNHSASVSASAVMSGPGSATATSALLQEDISTIWTISDTARLQTYFKHAHLCPPQLTYLYALHCAELHLLHPSITISTINAPFVLSGLHPSRLESAESSSSMYTSATHTRAQSVNISANRGNRFKSNKARNPIAQFCRSLSKGFQRALAPDEPPSREFNRIPNDARTSPSEDDPDSYSETSTLGRQNSSTASQVHNQGLQMQVFGPGYSDYNDKRHVGGPIISVPSNTVGRAGRTVKPQGIKIVGVAGLNNFGNTCYMSSALQCLFRTPLLVNYFQTQQYRVDISNKSPLGSKGKVTQEFAKVLSAFFGVTPIAKKSLLPVTRSDSYHVSSSGRPTSPKQQDSPRVQHRELLYQSYSLNTLLKLFQAHKPQFSGADQQDSQEFLSELLDTLHEDLKQFPLASPNAVSASTIASASGAVPNDLLSANGSPATANGIDSTQDTKNSVKATAKYAHSLIADHQREEGQDSPVSSNASTGTVQQQGTTQWDKYREKNRSIVSDLFQGQTCSKIICKVCNASSATFEPFTTLSMPIPRARSNSISQHQDVTTVIITIHRKMPRLSQILRLPDEAFDNNLLTQGIIYDLYNASRQPIKLALQCSRFTTLEQVLTKALQMYNAYEAESTASLKSTVPSSEGESIFADSQVTPIARNGSRAQNLHQLSPSSPKSSNSQVVDVTQTQQREGNAELQNVDSNLALPSVARGGEAGGRASAGSDEKVLPPTPPGGLVPPLSGVNTIIIDVNDKQKGRFGKMLDKRETLQTLQDEVSGECHLLLQERCKDISFVASLQGSRLSKDYEQRFLAELNGNAGLKSIYFSSLLDYFDTHEYDLQHVLYNSEMTVEGRLLADFDYTYDISTYPEVGELGSVSSQLRLPVNPPVESPSGKKKQLGGPSARLAAQQLQDSVMQENMRSEDLSFSGKKRWPQNLAQFQVGDRVDAVDYKGSWYPGSVIDILYLTEKDIKTFSLSRYSREFIRRDDGNIHSSSANAGSSKLLCSPGLHIRIHFDSFKGNWDEWYDQKDFELGFIAPVYTKTARKLKMHEIPIIQRKLVYSTQQSIEGAPSPERQQQEDEVASLLIEIMDTPSFIQAESYRSCAHLGNLVHEQMLRYVEVDVLMECIEKPAGDESLPFSVRLLSFDNLLMPPVDHFCPITTNTLLQSTDEGGSEVRVCRTNTCPVREFTVGDRFNGHKSWEGSVFPMDTVRPVINLYHNKLAISVDWYVPKDAKASTQPPGQLMHERMLYRMDMSYVQFAQAQKEKAALAQQTAQRMKEQLQRAELEKQACSDRLEQRTLSEDELQFLAYKNDMRAGLTIEDVLSKFVRSEDIEEYSCSHCKKPTSGKLHFSIHTLPDILIFHLQRLVLSANGGGKIRTLVKFPLSQLNMQPFTTEHKEWILEQAKNAAASDMNTHRSCGNDDVGEGNCSDESNRDVYELFGVVNHIGGMHGGHYTAVSKVEEIVLQDIASLRHHAACTTASSFPTANDGQSSSVALSLEEFISMSSTSTVPGTGVGEDGSIDALSVPKTLKWVKFDDEFVNALATGNLHNSIVTESAFLLFYKRKQLSERNLMKYM